MTKNKDVRKAVKKAYRSVDIKVKEEDDAIFTRIKFEDAIDPTLQVCFVHKDWVSFETLFPERIDEEDIPYITTEVMGKNKKMIMGGFDVDADHRMVKFRSSIFFDDPKDLDRKVLTKHIGLGFSMISVFHEEIWEHAYDVVPGHADVMYD